VKAAVEQEGYEIVSRNFKVHDRGVSYCSSEAILEICQLCESDRRQGNVMGVSDIGMMMALHKNPLDGDRAPACRRLQVFVQQWEREPRERPKMTYLSYHSFPLPCKSPIGFL